MRRGAEIDLKEKIKKAKGQEKKDRKKELNNLWPTLHEEKMAMWMGFFERCLYIIFYLTNQPTLISAWLVVKIIGNWGDRNSTRVDRFLIGTGLSLLAVVIIFWFIKYNILIDICSKI